MDKSKQKVLYLLPLLIILSISLFIVNKNKVLKKTRYYDEQIAAYEKMEYLSGKILEYRLHKDIPLREYDYFKTGLLGDEFNELTTTLGYLDAKRTAANPEMAALIIRLFKEIGLKSGDEIAVGFSGSFPGLNIAVLSAAETMDLKLTIISSFGASTFGANEINFSFPEILNMLYKDGHTPYKSDLITLGGSKDVLADKSQDAVKEVKLRFKTEGLNLYIESDYNKNLKHKIDILDSDAPKAFIAVGGNISFLGKSQNQYGNNTGIIKPKKFSTIDIDKDSSLTEYFLYSERPVIQLINIKKLTSDYGLPFDPSYKSKKGESSIFWEISYNRQIVVLTLFISTVYLYYFSKKIK